MTRSQLTTSHTMMQISYVLDAFFEKSIKQSALIDPAYGQLWQSLHALMQSGGKRLRPRMTILAYQAFGGTKIDSITPVAVAQELLHFSLLIHDDIIDRDYVRYGVANVAGQYEQLYRDFVTRKSDRFHYAHSAAILGGDVMISAAYQMILDSDMSDSDKITAQRLLGQGIFEVAAGELLDTELAFRPSLTVDALTVARYKTASYSFVTPLLTGATLAGASDDQCNDVREYAVALGIAYQLADDLLGVFGANEETGKSTSSDIREGKHTYIVEQALLLMSDAQREVFHASFGNPHITDEQVLAIKQIFIDSTAREKTEMAIQTYATLARKALNNVSLPAVYHDQLNGLIDKSTKRSF